MKKFTKHNQDGAIQLSKDVQTNYYIKYITNQSSPHNLHGKSTIQHQITKPMINLQFIMNWALKTNSNSKTNEAHQVKEQNFPGKRYSPSFLLLIIISY